MSPTARTLEFLRAQGVEAQVVERRIPHGHTTIDLFGCIDIVAMPGDILGIQTTTGEHHANRVTKASEEPRILRWLLCGGAFEVWSWSQRAQFGGRWTLRRSVARLTSGPLAEDPVTIEWSEPEV